MGLGTTSILLLILIDNLKRNPRNNFLLLNNDDFKLLNNDFFLILGN